jgi:uncharacterized protein (DUF427 family)
VATITFNGQTIAESDKREEVSGYVYVPHESINKEFFKPSNLTTVCGAKGTANYYSISCGGKEVKDACWYYPTSKMPSIKNWVGFYEGNGVVIKKK